jgi:transcriptional regulatory protein GAL4
LKLVYAPLYEQPSPNKHILDSMIDTFGVNHVRYPIVHKPTFRAQYSEVIPRPNGDCWLILAYTISAIGVFTIAKSLDRTDLSLFAHAQSIFSVNFLEIENLTMEH